MVGDAATLTVDAALAPLPPPLKISTADADAAAGVVSPMTNTTTVGEAMVQELLLVDCTTTTQLYCEVMKLLPVMVMELVG